ncbi:hypothetical protein EGW08_011342 [Elysia chlorotica]|uniref:ShKT domain-containing protein n=1 Tax=Elysia chlorotica TaxID=188477 RepID=A0A3S1BDC4_ELYCH|nr:hypothetical protein EGW08_011342 [Elysia chlorotica]
MPTQPPPCVDKLPDCATYESGSCTSPSYRAWAEENCRAHCRFCTSNQLAALDALTTRATTRSPATCVDLVDCSRYGQDACNPALYGDWGAQNCPAFCGICQGVATPGAPCADTRADCNMFQSDLCTNALFSGFVDGNCRKFCGKC